MKKFLVAVLMLAGSLAQAEVKNPLYTCAMAFDIKGGGAQFVVGHYLLTGKGKLVCTDIQGNRSELPLKVTMGGAVEPSIGFGYAHIVGLATGIGVSKNPNELLGDYVVAGGQAALVVGAGAQVALHAADKALTLNADLQLVKGLGLNIGLNSVRIEAAN